MSRTLRSESRRLSRAFGALVLAMSPVAAVQACSDATGPDVTSVDGSGRDGVADDPSEVDLDTGSQVDLDTGPQGLDAFCNIGVEFLDAGPESAADADLGCRYSQPCGLPDGSGYVVIGCDFYAPIADDAASLMSLGCRLVEGRGCTADAYAPPANGGVTFDCLDCFGGVGRRPAGLLRARRNATTVRIARRPAASPVGAYFARMAHDEGASVIAFVRMRDELARLGAPADLIEAAARSSRDEERHERMMARCARALGARAEEPRARRAPARSPESIARENAVEGCVNETYGALLMRWQAAHAKDASHRRLFARVAADETRHATLSWLVAHWLEPRLDAGARQRVAAARARAERRLRAKIAKRARTVFDDVVGHPASEHAIALLDGMLATLRAG